MDNSVSNHSGKKGSASFRRGPFSFFHPSRWHLVRVMQLITGSFLAGSYFLGYPEPGHLALGLALLALAIMDRACPFGGSSCRLPR